MNIQHLVNSAWAALVAASLALLLVLLSFFMLEPIVGRAQTSDSFTVTQTIVSEISFYASTTDVVMSPSINGLTGGFASGTTQVRVLTNNSTGYNMTVKFGTSTQPQAKMAGLVNGGYISDYSFASTAPEFNFNDPVTSGAGVFAFTVNATDTADVHSNFRDNGTYCGQAGGSVTAHRCWMAPTNTAYSIIDRSSATPDSGATTTLQFKVAVPNNPNPALPNDNYLATVTVTATTNP